MLQVHCKYRIKWNERVQQSQSSYGMVNFENVYVQAAKEWLLTQWVGRGLLVLNSVNDGAARERLHMERVASE